MFGNGNRLALGCEALGGTDWGQFDTKEARDAVRCALDVGISVFDTADVYGLGRGEEELSRALGSDRHEVTLVTKGGLRWGRGQTGARASTWRDSSRAHLSSAIEASLRRLRIDTIPLYLVHWPDRGVPLVETLECLEEARSAGKIQNYGLSNFSLSEVRDAARHVSPSAVEGPLSLLSTDDQLREMLAQRELGLDTLAYGALAQGLLTRKYGKDFVFDASDRRLRLGHFSPDAFERNAPLFEAVSKVASEVGRPAAQVAIRWVLESEAATCVIVGAKSKSQVLSNADSLQWSFDNDARSLLQKARAEVGLAEGPPAAVDPSSTGQ